MRKLLFSLLVLGMLGTTFGCDSGGDDNDGRADAEVFVGSWQVANLLLNGQDFTALLLANTQVAVVFDANGGFDLTLTSSSGTTDITGTYSVNESQETVTLTSSSFTDPVVVNYDVQNDNRIVLETDDVALFVGLTGVNPDDLGITVESITLIVTRMA